jgi:GIY-YIG catalytic domain
MNTYHYTVYRTTNAINGKTYVGVHKTKNPNDRYLGSGLALKNAVARYGRGSFTKEVLFDFDTADAAYAKEKELVNEAVVSSSATYNMRQGGSGAYDQTVEANERRSGAHKALERIVCPHCDTPCDPGNAVLWHFDNCAALTGRHRYSVMTCPHCNKSSKDAHRYMKQYHFDNCKHRVTQLSLF